MSGDPRGRSTGQADLFRQMEPPREPVRSAPFQVSSATSEEAAKRIAEGPAFAGNRLACLKELARSERDKTWTTRKEIAERLFAGKQNYVTGPIAVLIEEGLVYEEPARDRHGAIMTNGKNKVIPKRIDGSAVLRLTNRGIAATRGAA